MIQAHTPQCKADVRNGMDGEGRGGGSNSGGWRGGTLLPSLHPHAPTCAHSLITLTPRGTAETVSSLPSIKGGKVQRTFVFTNQHSNFSAMVPYVKFLDDSISSIYSFTKTLFYPF